MIISCLSLFVFHKKCMMQPNLQLVNLNQFHFYTNMSIRLKNPCPNSRYRPKLLLRLFHFSSWQKVYEPPTKLTIANSLTKQQPLIGNGGVGIERDKASKTLSVLPPLGENISTTPQLHWPFFREQNNIIFSLFTHGAKSGVSRPDQVS